MFSLVLKIFLNYEIKSKDYKRKQIIEVYLPKLRPSSADKVKKMKRGATQWKKICVKCMLKKNSVSKVYEDLLQLTDCRINNLNK